MPLGVIMIAVLAYFFGRHRSKQTEVTKFTGGGGAQVDDKAEMDGTEYQTVNPELHGDHVVPHSPELDGNPRQGVGRSELA